MAISPYLRALRARVGHDRLLLASVAAVVRDDDGRVLLVRQRDDDVWSTPGGTIEPDESPADAVVRETWEETGLLVAPRFVLAVFGGPEFVVRYPSGDETQYVIIAFACERRGGALRADGDETVEVRYWSEPDARRLVLSPWLRRVIGTLFAPEREARFAPASWSPPASA